MVALCVWSTVLCSRVLQHCTLQLSLFLSSKKECWTSEASAETLIQCRNSIDTVLE